MSIYDHIMHNMFIQNGNSFINRFAYIVVDE